MSFLEKLQAHKGCLLRLKTQLFWYEGRGWDNNPGRICLVLDASPIVCTAAYAALTACADTADTAVAAAALLLLDGSPQWIWVTGEDVEIVSETR